MVKNKLLEDYYLSLKYNYLAKTTMKNYIATVKIFFEFIIDYYRWNITVEEINVFFLTRVEGEAIITFLSYLKFTRKIKLKSVSTYVSAIKSFFKWLYQKYKSILNNQEDPTIALQDFRVRTQRLPKYIKLEDALKLQNIYNPENSRNYLRNNAIITLFLNTGIRLSELVGLDISDIDFDTKSMEILGKGNKRRTVFLTDKAIRKIQLYLKTRDDNIEALFISSRNQRISNKDVQDLCSKAYELAGLSEEKYTVHTLRHTAATYMYRETKDILIVKEFLRAQRY